MNRKLGVCIVGMGRAGRFHLTSIDQMRSADLVYAIDPNLGNEDAFVIENDLKLTNFESILGDPNVDAVIISTPTQFHFDYITRSLKAGKHVFAEKPLGKSVEQINMCYNLAEENNLALHLGFQRRFDHNFQTLRNRLNDIGEARIIKTSSRDNPKPSIEYLKISGNIFHDMLIHDFDMLCYLFGPEIPETIYAVGHAYDPEIAQLKDYDTVMVNIQYANGRICSIDTSRTSAYGYDQRIEIFGDQGMAIAENEKDSTVQLFTSQGILQDKVQHSFPQRYKQSYLREIEQFIDGIKDNHLFTVSRKECLLSHLIADAAHESVIKKAPIPFAERYGAMISEIGI